MAVDYDLVILGGSLEGRIAAITAVKYGARVALVEPPGLFEQRQQKRYLLQALQQLGEGLQRQGVVRWFQQEGAALSSGAKGNQTANWDWQAVLEWSAIAASTQNPKLSPEAMNISGIDVILETPERLSRQLVVTTATRRLKARGILAAFGTVPLPVLGNNSSTGIEPLLSAAALPKEITVWGDSGEAVMWAEALCLMGSRVRLVSDRFLRFEDADVKRLVRSSLGGASPSQLTTLGVSIVSTAEALKPDRQTLAKNALRLGQGQPALTLPEFVHSPTKKGTSANYPGDYQIDRQGHGETYLLSNERLQTSHPRIFACGSLIAGFPMPDSIATAEAQVAVRNALFLPTRKMRYRAIPESYHRFARVGQTPRFARAGQTPGQTLDRGDGNAADWQIWTASSANSTDLSRVSPWPLYCKLICYDGRLQSIHLLGDGASALIKPLTAAIGKPVSSLAGCLSQSGKLASGELASLVGEAARQSWQSKWQPGHWRRDWAENWFNWRRSR